jgi:GYD domain
MHYLAMGRYNAQGAAGILKDGLTSRKEIIKAFAEREGSTLLGFWGVESSDVDFVILVEGDTPPALGAANSFGQRSMGHLETLHTYTLVATEDIDAALKAHETVTSPPG